jgi:hypothetical protein
VHIGKLVGWESYINWAHDPRQSASITTDFGKLRRVLSAILHLAYYIWYITSGISLLGDLAYSITCWHNQRRANLTTDNSITGINDWLVQTREVLCLLKATYSISLGRIRLLEQLDIVFVGVVAISVSQLYVHLRHCSVQGTYNR